MADPYGLTQSGMAPELQAEYRGLTRQQAIQEALLKQSMMPAGGVIDAGHFKVARSPLEGLGKVAQAYMARQGLNESDKKFAELGSRQAQMTADEVRRYQQMKTGTPEVPATPAVTDVAQTNQSMDTFDPQAAVAGQAAVPGNARGAIEMAMLSRNPMLQKLGAMDSSQQQAKDIQQANLEQRIWETQEKGKDRLLQIQESAAQGRISKAEADAKMAELKLSMQASQQQHEKALRVLGGQIAAAGRQPVAPLQITDASGNVRLVDRNGTLIKDLGVVGKPSASFEKSAAAKKKMGTDINEAISELEKATADGGLIDKSTGSGAGAAVDAVAGFFGQATPGAVAVGQIAPIFDLVLKMVPRFEGPQSDKDTASYKEAAGQLSNPKTPNEIKKTAGKEILRLMKQRKGQFIDKGIQGTEADTPSPVDAALKKYGG